MKRKEYIKGITEEFLESRIHPDFFDEIKNVCENVNGLLKLPKDLEEILVKESFTIIEHPEPKEEGGEKLGLTEKGIKQAKEEIAVFLKKSFGKLNGIKVYYDDSLRNGEFAEILKEELGEMIELSKEDKGLSSVSDLLKEEDTHDTKGYTKTVIGDYERFIKSKVDDNSDNNHKIILAHKSFFASPKDNKETPKGDLAMKLLNAKHGEVVRYDINFAGKVIKENDGVLEINMYNQAEICSILEEEDLFKNIISDYRNQEIDYVQLQNSINYIFYKNPKLKKEYYFTNKIILENNVKNLIEEIKEYTIDGKSFSLIVMIEEAYKNILKQVEYIYSDKESELGKIKIMEEFRGMLKGYLLKIKYELNNTNNILKINNEQK